MKVAILLCTACYMISSRLIAERSIVLLGFMASVLIFSAMFVIWEEREERRQKSSITILDEYTREIKGEK